MWLSYPRERRECFLFLHKIERERAVKMRLLGALLLLTLSFKEWGLSPLSHLNWPKAYGLYLMPIYAMYSMLDMLLAFFSWVTMSISMPSCFYMHMGIHLLS